MGSDRARISYDERQQYRSVVMQQGRVTLEADWNESQAIAGEEAREETLDIVGTAGTPDNGYAVSFSAALPAFDFEVEAGTMYVGGMRASLPAPVQYSAQSDWLDSSIDPEWSPLPEQASGNEYVYLQLREQEVSAVEDSDLRDVALGGPDTAQRTRLIQHITRLNTDAKDCPAALKNAGTVWAAEGLNFDSATMRLKSSATLQVGFVNASGPPTPCDPVAQGGFLGADNQLIRVQVSNVQKSRTGAMVTKLVWGYDNASFLYRVDVVDPTTLKLQSIPVDAEHQPAAGQTVEVLMAAAELANGEFVAAPRGFVAALAAGYNPDTQTVTLPDALPAAYGDGNPDHPHPPRIFLRVWQQELMFVAGTAVALGDTGLQVTVTTTNNVAFHAGDYWMFAVRPSTPQQVYPERYLVGPQPPDGPRIWICPLAVIGWNGNSGSVLADCRNPFDNLVALTGRKLGGCCTVNIKPSDLNGNTTLQSILDRFRGSAGVNVCFMPGTYNLTQPLKLSSEHSNFKLEACAGGVGLQAAQGAEAAFPQGLIVLNAASGVTFRGIDFFLPLSPFGSTSVATPGTPQTIKVFVAVGLRAAACQRLTVEQCRFVYPFPGEPSGSVEVGVLAAGNCQGLQLTGNRFESVINTSTGAAPPAANLTGNNFFAGFVLFPTTVSKNISPTSPLSSGSAQVLTSVLHDAAFRDNLFEGLTIPAWVYADCGRIEIESNIVRNCPDGFCFLSLPSLALLSNLAAVNVPTAAASSATGLQTALLSAIGLSAAQLAGAVVRGFPLPDGFDLGTAISVALPYAGPVVRDATLLQSVFDRTLALSFRPTDHPVGTTPTGNIPATQIVTLGESVLSNAGFAVLAAATGQFNPVVLNQSYSTFEKLAFGKATPTVAPLALHVSNCNVSTVVPGASGLSLLIWNLGKHDADSIAAHGNVLSGANSTAPVAVVIGVSRNTVTGNIVLNEANRIVIGVPTAPSSLWLLPLSVTNPASNSLVAAATVIGNVFRGPAVLPPRDLTPAPPAPMDSWHFFNSET